VLKSTMANLSRILGHAYSLMITGQGQKIDLTVFSQKHGKPRGKGRKIKIHLIAFPGRKAAKCLNQKKRMAWGEYCCFVARITQKKAKTRSAEPSWGGQERVQQSR